MSVSIDGKALLSSYLSLDHSSHRGRQIIAHYEEILTWFFFFASESVRPGVRRDREEVPIGQRREGRLRHHVVTSDANDH